VSEETKSWCSKTIDGAVVEALQFEKHGLQKESTDFCIQNAPEKDSHS